MNLLDGRETRLVWQPRESGLPWADAMPMEGTARYSRRWISSGGAEWHFVKALNDRTIAHYYAIEFATLCARHPDHMAELLAAFSKVHQFAWATRQTEVEPSGWDEPASEWGYGHG